MEDRGRRLGAGKAPEGVGYEYMQSFMDDVAAEVAKRVPKPTLHDPGSVQQWRRRHSGAYNNGFVRMFLKDKSERNTRSQARIATELQSLAGQFTAARLNITQEASIGERQAGQAACSSCCRQPSSESLKDALPNFIEAARASGVFSYVDSDLKFGKPEIQVHIDRDKARALGCEHRGYRANPAVRAERAALRLFPLSRKTV